MFVSTKSLITENSSPIVLKFTDWVEFEYKHTLYFPPNFQPFTRERLLYCFRNPSCDIPIKQIDHFFILYNPPLYSPFSARDWSILLKYFVNIFYVFCFIIVFCSCFAIFSSKAIKAWMLIYPKVMYVCT